MRLRCPPKQPFPGARNPWTVFGRNLPKPSGHFGEIAENDFSFFFLFFFFLLFSLFRWARDANPIVVGAHDTPVAPQSTKKDTTAWKDQLKMALAT